MNEDKILWEGLKQGDKQMFLSLYKKYYHALLFIGLKEIKDAQVVKDSIQQLFLYLWEKRETIQDARNIKSYLVISFLRKLTADWKKGNAPNMHVVCNNFLEDPQPTPEEKLIKKDEQSRQSKLLMTHISELPNRQRELIVLKFYEGLTYEEIVQRTGLSHRTVYNKIHEALKKLRFDIGTAQGFHKIALMGVITALAAFVTISGSGNNDLTSSSSLF